jgi:hypothetical protein
LLSGIGKHKNLGSKGIIVPTHEEVSLTRSRWSDSSFDVYQHLIDASDQDDSVAYWMYLWFWCRYNNSYGSETTKLIDGKPADDIFARFGAREVGYVYTLVTSTLCGRGLRQFASHIESFELQSLLNAFSLSTNRPATPVSSAFHADLDAVRGALVARCVETLAVTVTEKPLGRHVDEFNKDLCSVNTTMQALIAVESDAIGAIR